MGSKTGKRRTEKRMSEKEAEDLVERDKQIAAGKYSVSELETLKLQKLMYQNNVAAKDFQHLQEKLGEAHAKAQKAQGRFMKELGSVRAEHGLEEWHDVKLDDDDGGIVFVNEKLKAEVEAKEKAAKKQEEASEKEDEEAAPAADKTQLEGAESK